MGWYYLSIHKLQQLHRWSLGMDKLFHPTPYQACHYLSILGIKLNHVGKRGPKSHQSCTRFWCALFWRVYITFFSWIHVTFSPLLIHWGPVIHICVSELTTIDSDNGLSPIRRQAIIWINAGILLIEPLRRTNFIQENVFENVVWKMAFILSRP